MSASPSCGHNAANAYAAWCRYCCKSPRWPGADFPAVEKSDRRPLIRVPSIALPRSSASLSSDDEVPRIFTRKSRLKPGKFLITSAKRLLQQNLPQPDSCTAADQIVKGPSDTRNFSLLGHDAIDLHIEGAVPSRNPANVPLPTGHMFYFARTGSNQFTVVI